MQRVATLDTILNGATARVEPGGCAALAERVREAAAARSRLAPRGAGSWWPNRAAAALDASQLEPLLRIEPGDLVATASASCTMAALSDRLRSAGAWVALDAPGGGGRTLGSVLATGTAGPLAARFGPPRDQVLGLTFLCGNSRVATSGGRVVKNVAGFDLAKVVIGAYGAHGLILGAHLRLRALPEADATIGARGSRAAVAAAAARLMTEGFLPCALEVVNPPLAVALGMERDWTLLVRVMGARRGVDEESGAAAALLHSAGLTSASVPDEVWSHWSMEVAAEPVVTRLGALPARWQEAVDLAERFAGSDARCSVTVPRGTVRVAGRLSAEGARALRREAGSLGWPVVVERGDAALLGAVGVWGSLPPGAAGLANGLREVFDPDGVFSVPLGGMAG
jgi:glycolate oxidase FAD binding subunit